MPKKITHVILDFDGTCTQIPPIFEKYYAAYLQGINSVLTPAQQISDADFKNALNQVAKHSPYAGWTAATTPSAPAAADPYIRSGEAARFLFTTRGFNIPVPLDAFLTAYKDNPAPWRPEALEVIQTLMSKGVSVHLVTNSSTTAVAGRLQELFGNTPVPPGTVIGNAGKFHVNEPDWFAGISQKMLNKWNKVPIVQEGVKIGRPVYLHRGDFFTIIATLFKDQPDAIRSTVFCGDVWELDLGLPAHLGGKIHLVERASPFDTYGYERKLTKEFGGKISKDLTGLLKWI